MTVSVGQTLGAHRLEKLIGKGAFGQVFRAVATCNAEVPQGARVAIKLLHDIYADDEKIVLRFHREARLATRLLHPNAVRVYSEGVQDGEHYIVMELAPGQSLTTYLGHGGVRSPGTETYQPARHVPTEAPGLVPESTPTQIASDLPRAEVKSAPAAHGMPKALSVDEAVEITRQVAGVLQAAWDVGLVHRDIKPDNLFVEKGADGRVRTKVLDFGLAKDLITQSATLSTVGHGMGTPRYMSPEQFEGRSLDVRSDLYSLGVTAYEMLTGHAPFPGPTMPAYMKQHLQEAPIPAHRLNPAVPPDLSQVVDRLLQKRPGNRYQTPADLIADLNHVQHMDVPLRRRDGGARRSFSRTALTILLTVLVGGGLFWGFLRWRADRRADALVRRRAYETVLPLLRAAYARAQARKDEPPWEEVQRLAEQAMATGYSDLSEARRLLLEASRSLASRPPWKPEVAQVTVATPEGDRLRAVTYYANTIGIKLVRVPAGRFQMGSDSGSPDEKPAHVVEIDRPFYMGACEVTNAQFRLFRPAQGRRPANDDDMPVVDILWQDAKDFCVWLSRKEHVTYRLPTEAEWEYACRAGSRTPYYWGQGVRGDCAWHEKNSGGRAQPVGGKLPNAFGLYDMSGNVWEYCQSQYRPYPYRADDGREELGGFASRVVRSGSWLGEPAKYLRSSIRGTIDESAPSPRRSNIGFRVVCVAPARP